MLSSIQRKRLCRNLLAVEQGQGGGCTSGAVHLRDSVANRLQEVRLVRSEQ